MKLWISLSGILIFYFVYGFYLSQFDIIAVRSTLRSKEESPYNDYRGVINVHTNLSTGSSTPYSVIQSAQTAGLDFLVLTDLNIQNYPKDLAKYHNRTLVLTGSKNSYIDSRVVLLHEKNQLLAGSLGEIQTQVSDLLTQSSPSPYTLSILAHPFMTGFSWTGDIPTGLDGMELLNIKSLSNKAWSESRLSVIWSLLMYPFNPELSFLRLFSEPSDELSLFDKTTSQRRFFAFAGAEANAKAIPIANYLIKFPSYLKSFSLVTNHILLKSELTGNSIKDNEKIFGALKTGQFYLCNELLGDSTGFYATINDEHSELLLGSQKPYSKNLQIKVHLPGIIKYPFEVNLVKDGQFLDSANTSESIFKIPSPGTYRIQIRVQIPLPLPDGKKWVTWIYSNPFFITHP